MRRLYHQWRQVMFEYRQFHRLRDDILDIFGVLALTVGAVCWGTLGGAVLANLLQEYING